MGHNDHIDFELHNLIRDLVDEGDIEEGTPAYGVAQQGVHSGYDTLSVKQRTLYDNVVIPALKRLGEKRCFIEIFNSDPE